MFKVTQEEYMDFLIHRTENWETEKHQRAGQAFYNRFVKNGEIILMDDGRDLFYADSMTAIRFIGENLVEWR